MGARKKLRDSRRLVLARRHDYNDDEGERESYKPFSSGRGETETFPCVRLLPDHDTPTILLAFAVGKMDGLCLVTRTESRRRELPKRPCMLKLKPAERRRNWRCFLAVELRGRELRREKFSNLIARHTYACYQRGSFTYEWTAILMEYDDS